MALVAIEQLFDDNQIDTDYQGKSAASRRFVVATTDKQAAILADNIPAISSTHPDFPDLKLDTYAVTVDGAGVTYVSCRYSNDRRFGSQRQPNKDNPAWYEWGWAQRAATVEVPQWRKRRIAAAGVSGGVKYVYELGKISLVEMRVIRPLRLRIVIQNVRDFDAIAAETNKLHLMPDGIQYLFLGGTVTQIDDVPTYDVSYSWERDTGTFDLPPEEPGAFVGYPEGVLFREPYRIWYAWQEGDPSVERPKMRTLEVYNANDNGWLSLPGADRLI